MWIKKVGARAFQSKWMHFSWSFNAEPSLVGLLKLWLLMYMVAQNVPVADILVASASCIKGDAFKISVTI